MRIFCFFIGALLLAILGTSSGLMAENSAAPKLRLGVSLPLTGDLAEYGVAVRNGIHIAKAQFPAQFEHLELIYEDNRYDAKLALTIFQKFRATRIDLIYSWGEVPFNAIAPIAEKYKLPLTAYSLDNSLARNSKYIVLTSNDPKTLTMPLVSILRKSGFKYFGVIKMEDPYINACINGFRSNLLPGETLEVISSALPGEMDMKPYALLAKSSKVDALGVYLYPGQISSFYRSLGALGVSKPTFGTDIFESPAEIDAAGNAMEGALYPNFKMPAWFSGEYLKRFKNDAQISYGYNGYAWAVITANVLAGLSGKPSAEQIIDKFKSAKGNEGGLSFAYRKTSDGIHFYEFPIIVRRVVNGKFETIDLR